MMSSKAPEEGTEHHEYKVEHGRMSVTAKSNFNNSNADDVFSNDNRFRFHSNWLAPQTKPRRNDCLSNVSMIRDHSAKGVCTSALSKDLTGTLHLTSSK